MTDLITFEKFEQFLEKAPVIVIDSCSLLDLYRYSSNSSKRILENFKMIQDSIWLPSQVLEEYFDNKDTVIREAHKKYENVSDEVLKLIKDLEKNITTKFYRYGKFKYPNINTFRSEIEEVISSLNQKATSFKEIVLNESFENKEVLREDELNSFILKLDELNQTGLEFSLPQKMEIYREGEFRYSHLIPPGYEDRNKDEKDPTKTKKFGDLILWKELLNKASEIEKPFLFITDDEKEDWWELEVKNNHLGNKVKILGPRKELVSEFEAVSKVGKDGFLMLTLPEFNKHISKANEVNLKEIYLNDIEFNLKEVANKIVESEDWSVILNGSHELTSSFINDGELQELTGEVLTDVEVIEILEPEFDDLYVDYDDDEVIIEGNFKCEVLVQIETALSSEYREWIEGKANLTGNICIEFNVEYHEENDAIERFDETVVASGITINHYEDLTTDKEYSDIACVRCGVRPGVYFTNREEPVCDHCLVEFDVCTGCGKLFEFGTLGGYKCVSCGD